MAFGFYSPTKAGVTDQWVPQFGPDFPSVEPVDFPEQISEATAGGTLYVQEKGAVLETFELNFSLMATADRDALRTFFMTKAKKAFNKFEYEDGGGTLHLVRWVNEFNFRKTHAGWYSGTIQLRKEPG